MAQRAREECRDEIDRTRELFKSKASRMGRGVEEVLRFIEFIGEKESRETRTNRNVCIVHFHVDCQCSIQLKIRSNAIFHYDC